MKLIKKVKALFNQFNKWLSKNNNLLSFLVALFSIIIAYKSLILADRSLKYSVIQYELSSRASDSLFKIQLLNSKMLNDSIINELNKVRLITDNQLNINNNQLIELKNITKPRIVISSFSFLEGTNFDSLRGYNANYGFKGLISLKNFGTREATNLSFKAHLIDSESYKCTQLKKGKITNRLGPDEEYNLYTELQSSFQLHKDYFICLQLQYFDPVVENLISNKFYYTYSDEGSEMEGNISKSTPEIVEKLGQVKE